MAVLKELFGIDKSRAAELGWKRNEVGDWVRIPNWRSPTSQYQEPYPSPYPPPYPPRHDGF